ncbi:MAG: hypothetical protein F4213_12090 [Boseongicola sp. SB0677_bin_26]|nr:hypothetical protein [Boseongicola sp. SB0677_bin_26]
MSDDAITITITEATLNYCLGKGHPKDHEQQRADELDTIKGAAIRNVLRKAAEGDVAALDWLERHGFITWQGPTDG